MVFILPFLLIVYGFVSQVMGNKMSDMEKTQLETQSTANKDKLSAMGLKFDSYINDLMTSLKAEHVKGDFLKKFISAHPDLDSNVVQSISVVLANSKMVDTKVTELLNKLDLSKKILNDGIDTNMKCLQMIVNYTDEGSDADTIKQTCNNAQMSLIKSVEPFNDEQQLATEISRAQKLIIDSTTTCTNVQSIIDNFIQSNNGQITKRIDPIDSYPTPFTIQSIQTELPAIQPFVPTLAKDSIASLNTTLNRSNAGNFSVDNNPLNNNLSINNKPLNNNLSFDKPQNNINPATSLPFDPVSPLPPPVDATGTPSLPYDGISSVTTSNSQKIPTLSTNDLNSYLKANTIPTAIDSARVPGIITNNLRDYTDEEYAVLLERIRKSMEFQNNLIVRNRLYLSRFDEILSYVNRSKQVLKGAISSIPRVSVDYDQTILQFDKLTENSDDIERMLGDIRVRLSDDVNLLTQLSQESKNCVDNLVVRSTVTYNKCLNVFNYWNDNSPRLQLDQNEPELFKRAQVITKSTTDMIASIKSSGMFMNKDVSDNETRDVPVAQSSDEEFISELNGMKPLTQKEDVTQMANDANDLIKSIQKEILYSESSFNNNYQLAQESQTEIEALSKNPVFLNPTHAKFFDECKQALKNSQIIPNNSAVASKFFSTNKDEINEITNDLTFCISSLTNMSDQSDDKKTVMEKCRQATSRTNKLNDVIKGDEFQNLITNMENSAKVLSQHAISMRTIAKSEAPLTEPSNNDISTDNKISSNGNMHNSNLRSSEADNLALANLQPSSTKIMTSLSIIATSAIAFALL